MRAVEETHVDVVQLLLDVLMQSDEACAAECAVRTFVRPATSVRAHVTVEVLECVRRVGAEFALVAEFEHAGMLALFVSFQTSPISCLEAAVVAEKGVSSTGVSLHMFRKVRLLSECAFAAFERALETHCTWLVRSINMFPQLLLTHEGLRAVLARVVGPEVDVLGMLGQHMLLLLLQ